MKSVAGVGSTFGFYVKTRRAAPPTAPASRSLSIVSTEAMTDVENLPHKDGELDVQIVTRSNTSELSDVTVENLHILVCEDNAINQKVSIFFCFEKNTIVSPHADMYGVARRLSHNNSAVWVSTRSTSPTTDSPL